jgi:hypothetical protein
MEAHWRADGSTPVRDAALLKQVGSAPAPLVTVRKATWRFVDTFQKESEPDPVSVTRIGEATSILVMMKANLTPFSGARSAAHGRNARVLGPPLTRPTACAISACWSAIPDNEKANRRPAYSRLNAPRPPQETSGPRPFGRSSA